MLNLVQQIMDEFNVSKFKQIEFEGDDRTNPIGNQSFWCDDKCENGFLMEWLEIVMNVYREFHECYGRCVECENCEERYKRTEWCYKCVEREYSTLLGYVLLW
jgi:hypothetical protein